MKDSRISVYKVMFNLPGSKFPTEVHLEKEKLKLLMEAMDKGAKIVELDGSFFNTAYFIQAVPDHELMMWEGLRALNYEDEETAQKKSELVRQKNEIRYKEWEDIRQKRIELTKQKHELQKKMLLSRPHEKGPVSLPEGESTSV